MLWKTPDPMLPKTAPPPFDLLEQLNAAQRHVRELQELLRQEKEQAAMFRQQRDDLQMRLDEIWGIVGR